MTPREDREEDRRESRWEDWWEDRRESRWEGRREGHEEGHQDALREGLVVRDAATRAVGRVMGHVGGRVQLRPLRGGREWDALPEDLSPVAEAAADGPGGTEPPGRAPAGPAPAERRAVPVPHTAALPHTALLDSGPPPDRPPGSGNGVPALLGGVTVHPDVWAASRARAGARRSRDRAERLRRGILSAIRALPGPEGAASEETVLPATGAGEPCPAP
ncbi:hypothetical protein [Streptomyces yaizuensis]|uniref:Uncharacterized protein n=1 Tax=Streptomyces yaizuensis TaxID=2989713 RepID=A0ABQ5P3R9_9ACTN|nr:hypothetical protein [Streptomyces sp. YSPA8]GLF97249.1 hypothetical protein SYYSPA8_23150 [Streptomyces sp. YSPA8]